RVLRFDGLRPLADQVVKSPLEIAQPLCYVLQVTLGAHPSEHAMRDAEGLQRVPIASEKEEQLRLLARCFCREQQVLARHCLVERAPEKRFRLRRLVRIARDDAAMLVRLGEK